MDDRKDDDDADPIRWSHNRKVQSFSQPLGRDAVIAAAKRSAASNRKLSLDTTTATSTSPTVAPSPYHQHHHAHHRSTSSESVPYPLQPFTSDPLTLDRAMTEFGGGAGTLPEFTGPGGNAGIFRAPIRAAVHPNRPPAVELRPHPLRETQFGAFLRTIVCAEREIWAGQESGLRVWRIADMFEVGGGRVKRGDEESAPFKESGRCSPTLCMVVDAATGVVWSGHKDGKIRSWKVSRNLFEEEGEGAIVVVEKGGRDAGGALKEGLSWQAHRSPVLCMAISSYGDIWSGSENGVVRVWPWESIDKSLCLSAEERHMAALLVERSYVDLRAICTVNGVCPLPPSDVKHMLADTGKSKIWSASSFSFALWDARKRELLKVFGLNGQVDSKVVDTGPPSQDSHGNEDDMKVKFVSSTKKEKSHSFLQRSRNALLGAADAVRRVAAKSAFAEDNRKTEALASTMDGMVWTGFNNGSLIQWDGNGNRVFDVQHQSHSVKSICTFGTRLWVGYVNGTVQVLDLEGNLIGSWTAHGSAVIKMAIGGSYIFTLANHGGIRGWNLTSPGPIDNILRSELSNKELQFTKYENLKILCGTWNVGQSRASHDSLISWLASAASEVGLVVVGLQEVEMGAGFLAMAATKEIVGLEGSANGQWWLDTIGKTLDEGTSFERVGSRQLAGLLIGAWARKSMRPHIGDVDAAAVACGLGRAIGNKGGVGLRMRVYDRIICFANCHFAAHLEAVSRRNADFDHIYRTMSFTRPSHGLQPSSGSGSSSAPLNRGGNVTASHSDDGRPELSEADMLVFLGDFNYRLHSITYDEARDMVSQRCFDWLREKDQLRAEMKCGKVFQGMREGQINFPPTYKFEKHKTGLSGFDSSEKKRIPAWCDRILYRDSRSIAVAECSLESPVVTSVTLYEACMDVTDSDHKPVRCKFNVEIARIVESIRRKECGELISSDERINALLREYCNVPETIVSTNSITLQNSEKSILRITNKCDRFKVSFEVVCEGQCTVKEAGDATEFCPKGSFGLPQWLQVHPAAGIAKPGQIIDVTVHYDEYYTQEEHVDGIPSNWWCEDTRDKEVILLVNVMGSYSTERMVHRVHVRRCLSPQASSLKETKGNTSARVPSNHFQVPDFADFENNSVDPGPDLSETRAP